MRQDTRRGKLIFNMSGQRSKLRVLVSGCELPDCLVPASVDVGDGGPCHHLGCWLGCTIASIIASRGFAVIVTALYCAGVLAAADQTTHVLLAAFY